MTDNSQDQRKGMHWKTALTYINLGWELALPIFLGVLFGNYFDKATNSKYHLTISFLVVGIALGYYNILRTIKKISKDDNDPTGK
jgi:predicted F0F1-ATPase subunit